MGRDPFRIFQKGEVHIISCASCARGIPFVLNIKSSGSNMTWVVPLRQGVRLKAPTLG